MTCLYSRITDGCESHNNAPIGGFSLYYVVQMTSTPFNDWKISLLGCIVACLVQRLPAWHSGYVLGTVGICLTFYSISTTLFTQLIRAHLTYLHFKNSCKINQILLNVFYSFLNPFFCRSFDNSTCSPKPPQVFFWTSYFSTTLWVGFWSLSPPPEATWTYAWLRPWRNARNENSSTLVQSITRPKKSRNLSQKLKWKGGRTYRWGIGP